MPVEEVDSIRQLRKGYKTVQFVLLLRTLQCLPSAFCWSLAFLAVISQGLSDQASVALSCLLCGHLSLYPYTSPTVSAVASSPLLKRSSSFLPRSSCLNSRVSSSFSKILWPPQFPGDPFGHSCPVALVVYFTDFTPSAIMIHTTHKTQAPWVLFTALSCEVSVGGRSGVCLALVLTAGGLWCLWMSQVQRRPLLLLLLLSQVGLLGDWRF